jgi:hypothetical protein
MRTNVLLASLVTVTEEESSEYEHGSEEKESKEEGEIVEEDAPPAVIEYASGVHPSNQLLLQFDQVLTQRLLAFFSNWLKLPSTKIWNNISEYDGSTTQSGGKMYSWIFALLSRLEKPLYMDASATVRDIYRHLCIQRVELANQAALLGQGGQSLPRGEENNNLSPTKRTRDNTSSSSSSSSSSLPSTDASTGAGVSPSAAVSVSVAQLPEKTQQALAVLNTVIVICGKYFGQEELVDFIPSCSGNGDKDKHDDNNDEPDKYSSLVPDADLYGVDAKGGDGCGDY